MNNVDFDIELNDQELESLIIRLETHNNNIYDDMNSIYDAIAKIEAKDWNSPEKTKLDSIFIPYLKRSIDHIMVIFNGQVAILENVLSKYKKHTSRLLNMVEDLER